MVSQIIPWLEEDQDKHSHLIGVTIGFVYVGQRPRLA